MSETPAKVAKVAKPAFMGPSESDTMAEAVKLATALPWVPEKGDSVAGTVVAIQKRLHPEWGPYPVVILDTGNNDYLAWHATGQLPLKQLQDVKPVKGDSLTVFYNGKRRGRKPKADGTPNDYHETVIIKNGEMPQVEDFTF